MGYHRRHLFLYSIYIRAARANFFWMHFGDSLSSFTVIIRQSALSWGGGGLRPQTPLLMDRRPKLPKTLDPKPLP